MTICADGHVFADVIGVDDATVTAYQDALRAMVQVERLRRLTIVDMSGIWSGADHSAMRHRIEHEWAPSVQAIREEARVGGESATLVSGITRFMVEDAAGWPGSRSQLQKAAKARAYRVLQRSRGWSALLDSVLPHSVRLSIHPQPPGARKFGVALVGVGDDVWTTPWHSVLVYGANGSPYLRPHAQVRDRLLPVYRQGRLSHYVDVLGLSA